MAGNPAGVRLWGEASASRAVSAGERVRLKPHRRPGVAVARSRSGRPPPAFAPAPPAGLRSLARLAVPRDPACAVLVVAVHHVGRPNRLSHLVVQRARDRRRQPRGDRHGEERSVERRPVREPEADVGCAAGRVDTELLLQPPHEPEKPASRRYPSPRSASRAGRRRCPPAGFRNPRPSTRSSAPPRSVRRDPPRCPSRRSRSQRRRHHTSRRAATRDPSARPRR